MHRTLLLLMFGCLGHKRIDEIAQLKQEKVATAQEQIKVEMSVVDMLEELQCGQPKPDPRTAESLAYGQQLIDAGKLHVHMVDGRMVVGLTSDVLFDSGSASLSSDGNKAVAAVSTILASVPDRRYEVEGHADSVPISTAAFPSNWDLASARSLTVMKSMLEAGIDGTRLSASSYGDTRPVAPNDTEDNRAKNRRIEIVVLPDLSVMPGFAELKVSPE